MGHYIVICPDMGLRPENRPPRCGDPDCAARQLGRHWECCRAAWCSEACLKRHLEDGGTPLDHTEWAYLEPGSERLLRRRRRRRVE